MRKIMETAENTTNTFYIVDDATGETLGYSSSIRATTRRKNELVKESGGKRNLRIYAMDDPGWPDSTLVGDEIDWNNE